MPDSVTIQMRGIALEDLLTNSTTAQVTQTVLGVGAVPLTPLVLAASDSAAAAAGCNVGDVYLNNASGLRLHVRQT